MEVGKWDSDESAAGMHSITSCLSRFLSSRIHSFTDDISSLSFSKDGRYLATGDRTGKITLIKPGGSKKVCRTTNLVLVVTESIISLMFSSVSG
jgi:hypothetical protein